MALEYIGLFDDPAGRFHASDCAAEACVPTSLTHADVVRLREEVGVAVASKDKSSLHRRWLEACHARVHGVVCQVEDVLHDCV